MRLAFHLQLLVGDAASGLLTPQVRYRLSVWFIYTSV